MRKFDFDVTPNVRPVLDKDFRPAVLCRRAFLDDVDKSGTGVPVKIALERGEGVISTFKTRVFDETHEKSESNFFFIERLVKSLLWGRGGWKLTFGGPSAIGDYLKEVYSESGSRSFDAFAMRRVYENPFVVEATDIDLVPDACGKTEPVGRHFDGCRIGFDAGGSDRKVSAVVDGEPVFSEEVVWHPKINEDPDYHYREILEAMKSAASHMPRVDAIGVSAAGIYVNNCVRMASLFVKVPDELFEKKVKNIFRNIASEMGEVPLEVANDGDVTALAGAMDIADTNVMGIAMGTSEAGGYVDDNGNITGALNEFAFMPVDNALNAALHEWSGDIGCGAKYFSQDAVIRLAPAAGIELDDTHTPAEKLKTVQQLHSAGGAGAKKIFESIGVYLGYAIADYSDFYDIRHILILGRVTSGEGGSLIRENALKVLDAEFPELSAKIKLHLPDESSRRVGQSIAAAGLPHIG